MIVSARNIRRVGIAFGLMLILCIGLLYAYASQLTCRGSEVEGGYKLSVAKAGQTVPKGAVLTSDLVVYEEVPERFLPPNPLLREDVNKFLHRTTNVELEAGMMILTSDFN